MQLGEEQHSAADHGLQLIHPNPLPGADGRYVVLNSGHTYHDSELRFSYMVFPRLGDWAVFKVGDNPPTASAPAVAESLINSGFFNEAWKYSRPSQRRIPHLEDDELETVFCPGSPRHDDWPGPDGVDSGR